MQDRTILARMEDIFEQTENITSVVTPLTFEEFARDVVYSAAVIRFFEIIGEAVKSIPDTVRVQYPDIAWRELAGLRDILIHNYPKVNLRQVWNFAVNDVQNLNHQIKIIIESMKEEL